LSKCGKITIGPNGEGYLQLIRAVSIQREPERTKNDSEPNYSFTRKNTEKEKKFIALNNGPTKIWITISRVGNRLKIPPIVPVVDETRGALDSQENFHREYIPP
jgi:hypothetical protein